MVSQPPPPTRAVTLPYAPGAGLSKLPDISRFMDVSSAVHAALENDVYHFASDTPQQRSSANVVVTGGGYALVAETDLFGTVYAIVDIEAEKVVSFIPLGAFPIQLDEESFAYIDTADHVFVYRKGMESFMDIDQRVIDDSTETFNAITTYVPMSPLVISASKHSIILGVFTSCLVDGTCGLGQRRSSPARTVALSLP